jgi:hypothetical protein
VLGNGAIFSAFSLFNCSLVVGSVGISTSTGGGIGSIVEELAGVLTCLLVTSNKIKIITAVYHTKMYDNSKSCILVK